MTTQSAVGRITQRDYQTIWRRGRESYSRRGEDEPEEHTYHALKRDSKNNIASTRSSRIKNVIPISHHLERRVISPRAQLTLNLGYLPWLDLSNKLKDEGYQISVDAQEIIKISEPTLAKPKEIELSWFPVKDIAPRWISLENFYSRAQHFGYGPCPVEVGPYLRLTNKLPMEEFLIGMEPVVLPHSTNRRIDQPLVFCIRQDNMKDNVGKWLSTAPADADHIWGFKPEKQVVLAKL